MLFTFREYDLDLLQLENVIEITFVVNWRCTNLQSKSKSTELRIFDKSIFLSKTDVPSNQVKTD